MCATTIQGQQRPYVAELQDSSQCTGITAGNHCGPKRGVFELALGLYLVTLSFKLYSPPFSTMYYSRSTKEANLYCILRAEIDGSNPTGIVAGTTAT